MKFGGVGVAAVPVGTPPTQRKALSLPDELRRLAVQPGLTDRRVLLANLAAAIDSGLDLTPWAELDLFRALDVDGDGVQSPVDSTVALWLERLLSILIFAPVLLTWVGLFEAARAYRHLVAANPAAGDQSFFTLWVGGFNGTSHLSLERMAFGAVAILTGVIVVNLLLHQRRGRDLTEAERAIRQARGELRLGATRATMALVGHRLASPERMRERITTAAEQLSTVVDNSRALVETTVITLDRMKVISEQLESGVTASAHAARTTSESTERLRQALVDLESGVQQTVAELTSENAAAVDRATQSASRSTAEVRQTITRLESAVRATVVQMTSEGTTALDRAATQMAGSVNSLQTGLDEALSRVGEGGVALAASAANSAGVVAELESLIRQSVSDGSVRFAKQTDQLEATTRHLGDAVAAASDSLAAQIDAASDRLGHYVDESSDLVRDAGVTIVDRVERALSTAEETYDRVGQAVGLVSQRLSDVAGQESRAGELINAHSLAISTVTDVVAALQRLEETQRQSQNLTAAVMTKCTAALERLDRTIARFADGPLPTSTPPVPLVNSYPSQSSQSGSVADQRGAIG